MSRNAKFKGVTLLHLGIVTKRRCRFIDRCRTRGVYLHGRAATKAASLTSRQRRRVPRVRNRFVYRKSPNNRPAFLMVTSNVCVGAGTVLLPRSIAVLEFDLVLKQILVLASFKSNQQKSASKIFGHRNERTFSSHQ